ncbi:NADPH-dependent FMN reductase [Solimonas marina]|uniref:NAD(P)H-dependent oxidoreductase n=1 Tax=Solimonas marina TaxID=2714601 RepID=A0A969W7A1_9GAMM|nr:NADPH-dependent FMN reductase [Solimonas marina]NKF21194.1 NAD(P)H-dependent oxidoreductase [Solimonas marina]
MNWLAICGSLRRQSTNLAVLHAAARLAPPGIAVRVYSLAALPLFNPDLEAEMPAVVREWRAAVAAADGLLISSPEYAHGVSGVLKNALDWLVSGPEFVGKPVALLNASTRAEHAPAQLVEILRTMSGIVVESASLDLPLLGTQRDADAIVVDPSMTTLLQAALQNFAATIAAVV